MNWKKILVSALLLAVSGCGIVDAQAGTKRADKFKADVLYLCKEQGSDPSTPATGTAGLYCKTDGRWYLIDDAGSVLKVGDATTLEDADGDTLVQVEESADEDIIRFDVLGSQSGRIDTTGWMLKGNDVAGDGPLHIGAGLLSGATANTAGNSLVLEAAGTNGLSILTGDTGVIAFGDAADNDAGGIYYEHGSNRMLLRTTANQTRLALSASETRFNQSGADTNFVIEGDTDPNLFFLDAGLDTIVLGSATGDASALLDMVSTTKGLGLPSQTTTERDAITTPRDGLMVYEETDDAVSVRANGAWVNLVTSAASGLISCETVQASTSGTSIDFTSLPSSIRRITVIFSEVSLSGTDNILVQIGDSGGLETSSYVAGSQTQTETAATSTSGFIIHVAEAARNNNGLMTLVRLTGNQWNEGHTIGRTAGTGNRSADGGGAKGLSGELDRLSITTSGSNTFDAGQINICHEL